MNMKKIFVVFLVIGFVASSAFAQQLTSVTFSRFDKAVRVDSNFANYISRMNDLAVQNDLYILVQGEGFRRVGTPVRNAIVPPSEKSNHLVGYAVDINIRYNGKPYNSSDLGNFNSLPQAIKNFINGCKSNGMRWGGDFRTDKDPVHFDVDLNTNNRSLYDKLYLLYQQ